MRVLVTGGRGVLGSHVVKLLTTAGHEALAAGRGGPVRLDLRAGEGLEDAVAGVEAIVHCASDPLSRDARVVEVEGTGRLVSAARSAGVAHLVFVSIVGVDRVPGYFYFRLKRHAEKVVEQGKVPWSILRATQFFPFIELLLTLPPVMLAPRGFVAQPVAVTDVAARLVRALADGPGGRLNDFGGPEVREVADLARSLRRARGLRRPLLRPWLPGRFAAAVRAGGLVATGGDRGTVTWEQWLSSTGAR